MKHHKYIERVFITEMRTPELTTTITLERENTTMFESICKYYYNMTLDGLERFYITVDYGHVIGFYTESDHITIDDLIKGDVIKFTFLEDDEEKII